MKTVKDQAHVCCVLEQIARDGRVFGIPILTASVGGRWVTGHSALSQAPGHQLASTVATGHLVSESSLGCKLP